MEKWKTIWGLRERSRCRSRRKEGNEVGGRGKGGSFGKGNVAWLVQVLLMMEEIEVDVENGRGRKDYEGRDGKERG